MRNSWITITLLSAVAAGLSGCASTKPQPTQSEAAQKQWSQARSGVLETLATDQYRNGNFDKCQATLDEALRLTPQNANLHILAARLLIEQGSLETAEKHLEQARKFDPTNPEVDYLTGVVLQRWQQPQQACDAYDAAVKKNPDELSYLMAKAEMLVALNKPVEALELLQAKVVYFEHSAAIRDAVGQLLVQQGRYSEGVATLRQASILAGDDQTIREHLAFALYYSKQYADAAEDFDALLKDPAYAKRADLFAALGECQCQSGRLPEARQSLELAIELDSNCAGYWLSLGRVALQVNDLPRAESAAGHALKIEADNGEAQCLLGYVRLRQGKFPQALPAFAAACRIDPADTVSLCMQGYVLEKMGRRPEATPLYEQALKIKPKDPLASQLLASDELQD
jgi:tetratricopeptide (TPR) repeat protein